jgi:hypothetical protein
LAPNGLAIDAALCAFVDPTNLLAGIIRLEPTVTAVTAMKNGCNLWKIRRFGIGSSAMTVVFAPAGVLHPTLRMGWQNARQKPEKCNSKK